MLNANSLSRAPRRGLILSALIIGLIVTGITLVVFRFIPKTSSQAKTALLFSREFMTDDGKQLLSFEKTQAIFESNMNCFFNTTIKTQIELENKEFSKQVKEGQPGVPPPQDNEMKCDNINKHPIAKELLQNLQETLKQIPDNQAHPTRQTVLADTDHMQKCNFSLPTRAEAIDKNAKLAMVFPEKQSTTGGKNMKEINYFTYKKSLTLTPSYALSTIGGCYKQMYSQYLTAYFLGTQPSVQIENTASAGRVSQEDFQKDQSRRENLYLNEMDRVTQAYEVSIASLDQMIKTYPVHTLYEQIIAHSQEVRDQIRRWRVATDQLVPKLINQTTKNYAG